MCSSDLWGIVIGEALACGAGVVAYDIEPYRPIFREFVQYVPCFDRAAFAGSAEKLIRDARAGRIYLNNLDLAGFNAENSWEAAQKIFVKTLEELALSDTAPSN